MRLPIAPGCGGLHMNARPSSREAVSKAAAPALTDAILHRADGAQTPTRRARMGPLRGASHPFAHDASRGKCLASLKEPAYRESAPDFGGLLSAQPCEGVAFENDLVRVEPASTLASGRKESHAG